MVEVLAIRLANHRDSELRRPTTYRLPIGRWSSGLTAASPLDGSADVAEAVRSAVRLVPSHTAVQLVVTGCPAQEIVAAPASYSVGARALEEEVSVTAALNEVSAADRFVKPEVEHVGNKVAPGSAAQGVVASPSAEVVVASSAETIVGTAERDTPLADRRHPNP